MNCCQHVNPFRLCTGLRVIGYCMILLVAALVGLSYYAVVIVAWVPRLFGGGLSDGALALFILVLFHVLLVLLLWSYFKVVFTDPGPVPENWGHALRDDNMEAGTSFTTSPALVSPGVLSSAWSPTEGTIRRPDIGYCNRCQNSKPPRCHHCSVCQRCVLKMDHHCVWVVNCVGARNYKFFLLFLFYTFLETILDSLALLPRFINFFGDAKNHSGSPGHLAITFLAFVLNVAFALSLLCFLAMHSSLLLTNTTTIEVHEKKKTVRWKYDLGKRQNFEQVFGTKKLYWFLPLFSKEDLDNVRALQGLEFPVQSGER